MIAHQNHPPLIIPKETHACMSRTSSEQESEGDSERVPGGLCGVLALTLLGWVAFMGQGFYWTEWVGLDTPVPGTRLRMAFVTLTLFACASLLTACILPLLVHQKKKKNLTRKKKKFFLTCHSDNVIFLT